MIRLHNKRLLDLPFFIIDIFPPVVDTTNPIAFVIWVIPPQLYDKLPLFVTGHIVKVLGTLVTTLAPRDLRGRGRSVPPLC